MTKKEKESLKDFAEAFVKLSEENQMKIKWLIQGVSMANEEKTK